VVKIYIFYLLENVNEVYNVGLFGARIWLVTLTIYFSKRPNTDRGQLAEPIFGGCFGKYGLSWRLFHDSNAVKARSGR
jgi:hypothetical protein